MTTNRSKGIIAYGTQADRDKLARLADLLDRSGSQVIIDLIRERFADLFGPDAA